jgi:hypothetical protein
MAEMTRKLVVVMDLGRVKAFRWEESSEFSNPRLVLLEDSATGADERLFEKVTDQAGQFSKGALSFAAVSDMSNGERHNLELEERRRSIKDTAELIPQILERENLQEWYLAAGSEINQMVMDTLDANTRQKMSRNVTANLTRLSTTEIINQFNNHS